MIDSFTIRHSYPTSLIKSPTSVGSRHSGDGLTAREVIEYFVPDSTVMTTYEYDSQSSIRQILVEVAMPAK